MCECIIKWWLTIRWSVVNFRQEVCLYNKKMKFVQMFKSKSTHKSINWLTRKVS